MPSIKTQHDYDTPEFKSTLRQIAIHSVIAMAMPDLCKSRNPDNDYFTVPVSVTEQGQLFSTEVKITVREVLNAMN